MQEVAGTVLEVTHKHSSRSIKNTTAKKQDRGNERKCGKSGKIQHSKDKNCPTAKPHGMPITKWDIGPEYAGTAGL